MYPNVRAEIARKGLTQGKVVERLKSKGCNMTESTFSQKMTGKFDFTLNEAKTLKEVLETDIPLEVLFEEAC